jgi:hypothetical protein
MTQHSPNLNLPYPDGTDSPDGAGQIAALALAIDGLLPQDDIAQWATIPGNAAYDSNNGLNAVTSFGPLKIVHFSIYRASGFQLGELMVSLKVGCRPSSTVHGGGLVYDAGSGGAVNTPASIAVDNTGSIVVTAFASDSGSDGRFNAARGTLIFHSI